MSTGSPDLTVELAGSHWLLRGLVPEQLGRLQQALVPEQPSRLPGKVTWQWTEKADGWEPLETEEEFESAFDYREFGFNIRGLRFHAEVTMDSALGSGMTAKIRVLRSAGIFTEFILENLMRVLVAYRAISQGGVLLHSACFTDLNRTWLMFGHSGAGKSTTSEFAFAAGFQVLSDDMNVVFPGSGGWQVRRVPFCGTCEKDYTGPASVPLTSICNLRQSDSNRLEPLSAATGVSLLVASAAFVNEDPWRAERLLENCLDLIQFIKVQALYFRRDPEFISLLTETNDSKAVA